MVKRLQPLVRSVFSRSYEAFFLMFILFYPQVSVSLDPGEWSNAFSRSYEAHEAEIHKDQELSMPSMDSSGYQ